MIDPPGSADASARLAVLERAAHIGAWLWDLEADRVHWSRGAHALTGIAEDAPLSPAGVFARFGAPWGERLQEACRRCASHDEPFDSECEFVREDGRRIWVRVIGEAVHAADRRIIALRGTLQDVTEDRRVREEAESAGRFRELADAMPVMVWTAAADGRVDHVNLWVDLYLGGDALCMLGDPHSGAIHPDDADGFARDWEAGLAAGRPFEVEMRMRRAADDSYRWHRAAATPLRRAGGGIDHWLGTAMDIHDERGSEARARDLSQRLASLFASITDGVMTLDREWRVTFINAAGERILGRTWEGVQGRVLWEVYPDLLGMPAEQQYRAAARTGEADTFEMFHPCLGAWLREAVYPSPEGLTIHMQDITERRAAEDALRERQERFKAIARAVTDVVWDWDLTDDTITWGEGLRESFGHTPEDLGTGVAWLAAVHADDRARVSAEIEACIARGAPDWDGTYRLVHADGGESVVNDRGVFLPGPDGTPVRFVGGMSDISRRLALEEQVRRSQRLEAVGHLVGGVAHDFNNLLTVIMGNTELLMDELADDDPRRELVEMTHMAAARGAELTHRLLAFARRQALDPQALDIGAALARVEALLRRTLREDITIECDVAPGTAGVFVDPAQFESALLNLAVNAQDAMPDGGRLVIRAAPPADGPEGADPLPEAARALPVCVTVSDTGAGIPPELHERVFEPFFTTKEVGRGTGLGLSMVYGFIRQSEGHIALDSAPGRGTTIRLYLPGAGPGGERSGAGVA